MSNLSEARPSRQRRRQPEDAVYDLQLEAETLRVSFHTSSRRSIDPPPSRSDQKPRTGTLRGVVIEPQELRTGDSSQREWHNTPSCEAETRVVSSWQCPLSFAIADFRLTPNPSACLLRSRGADRSLPERGTLERRCSEELPNTLICSQIIWQSRTPSNAEPSISLLTLTWAEQRATPCREIGRSAAHGIPRNRESWQCRTAIKVCMRTRNADISQFCS